MPQIASYNEFGANFGQCHTTDNADHVWLSDYLAVRYEKILDLSL